MAPGTLTWSAGTLYQVGFDRSSEALLGAVVVDTQADFLPPVRVEKGPFVAYERPQDVAYISNLAVLPATRRRGVGERLLAAAEKVCGACWLPPLHPRGSPSAAVSRVSSCSAHGLIIYSGQLCHSTLAQPGPCCTPACCLWQWDRASRPAPAAHAGGRAVGLQAGVPALRPAQCGRGSAVRQAPL